MLFKAFITRWREQLASWRAPDAIPLWAQSAVLVILIIATVGVRLTTIDTPPLERSLWKEIDYLMISENYWQGGYRFFQPEVSWPAEEPRATAMEMPLVPFVAAVGYALAGQTPLSVRWPTLLAFTLLGISVFFLVRREVGPIAGLAAAAAALAMPLHHTFGNLLFSDPSAICAGAASVLLLQRWLDSGRRTDAIYATLALGLTLALKVEMLYLGVCCAWLVWRRHRWNFGGYAPALGVAAGALALAAPWYLYAYWLAQHSIDVFGVFGGIYGGHDKFQTFAMLGNPDWYREMWGRVSWDLLGGKIGLALALAGALTVLISRSGGLIFAYLVAVAFYFVIVAEGQIDAPYRQLHAVPALAALVGYGAVGLVAAAAVVVSRFPRSFSRSSGWAGELAAVLAVVLVVSMPIRRFDDILHRDFAPANKLEWEVAMKVREMAGDGALIVTVGAYSIHKGGVDVSPVLYRYANARGWSLIGTNWSAADVEVLRGKGAALLVGIKLDREPSTKHMVQKLTDHYRKIWRGKDSLILDLQGPR